MKRHLILLIKVIWMAHPLFLFCFFIEIITTGCKKTSTSPCQFCKLSGNWEGSELTIRTNYDSAKLISIDSQSIPNVSVQITVQNDINLVFDGVICPLTTRSSIDSTAIFCSFHSLTLPSVIIYYYPKNKLLTVNYELDRVLNYYGGYSGYTESSNYNLHQ